MVKRIEKESLQEFYRSFEEYAFYEETSLEELGERFAKTFSSSKLPDFLVGAKRIQGELRLDLAFFLLSDPAAESEEEVVACYPGYHAIAIYRLAHLLRNLGFLLPSRILSEMAHEDTGIDIHPGAKIGVPFFIDHGTGTVIGETTTIGKNAKIYQGVTLGALSLAKGSLISGTKRHPDVGDNVTIYANASILGPVKIGDNVTIGGNVFLLKDVESNMKVLLPKSELVFLPKKGKES